MEFNESGSMSMMFKLIYFRSARPIYEFPAYFRFISQKETASNFRLDPTRWESFHP